MDMYYNQYMNKIEEYLNKYMNSDCRRLFLDKSPFLDEIMQRYIKAVTACPYIGDEFIDRLLKINELEIIPYDFNKHVNSGNADETYDEMVRLKRVKLSFHPNIALPQNINVVPKDLQGEDLIKYNMAILNQIETIIHELNHVACVTKGYIKNEDGTYRPLTEQDIEKENYTIFFKKGGAMSERDIVENGRVRHGVNMSLNYLLEGLTEFLAHEIMGSRYFADLVYWRAGEKRIDPYDTRWTYDPFVSIVMILNRLYNYALVEAYFTGESKQSGYNIDEIYDVEKIDDEISNIAMPIRDLIRIFSDKESEEKSSAKALAQEIAFGAQSYVNTLVSKVKEMKDKLSDSDMKLIQHELQNLSKFVPYRDCAEEAILALTIDEYNELTQIFSEAFETIDKSAIDSLSEGETI